MLSVRPVICSEQETALSLFVAVELDGGEGAYISSGMTTTKIYSGTRRMPPKYLGKDTDIKAWQVCFDYNSQNEKITRHARNLLKADISLLPPRLCILL